MEGAVPPFHVTKLEEIMKSLRKIKTALNLDKESSKMRRLVRSLNKDKFTPTPTITLEENGKLLAEKQAADHFAERFKSARNFSEAKAIRER